MADEDAVGQPQPALGPGSTPAGQSGEAAEISLGVASEITPKDVEVRGAEFVSPLDAPIARLPPLDQAGVDLAKWVLLMSSVFVLTGIIWIWISERTFSSHFNELTKAWTSESKLNTNLNKDTVETIIRARTEFREFWLKVFQIVLLNVLLPVLTALLGYVFGSRRVSNPSG